MPSLGGLLFSFYFVTFLMPIALATSLFFNQLLVPRFLLKERYLEFGLYLFYMVVVSVYLELLVMVLAFVILADYEFQNLGRIAGDIYFLTLILYLIVFIEGVIITVGELRKSQKKMLAMEDQLRFNKEDFITIRVNRKQVNVLFSELLFIESLGDYVKIHVVKDVFITREKISHLEKRLPDFFIRVHRSYIVNRNLVESYNRESILIGGKELPIGRKYKDSFTLLALTTS